MQTHLPELTDTDEKHERAHAKLRDAVAGHELKKEAAREAARSVNKARERLERERERLPAAQRELTEALAADAPTAKLQQAVSGHQANITSLEALLTQAIAAAAAADKAVGESTIPIGQAQQEIAQTRFYQLIAQLAAVLPPAIKICRELIPLGHQLGVSVEQSGYVLDLQRPNISHYTIADDGAISFLLR